MASNRRAGRSYLPARYWKSLGSALCEDLVKLDLAGPITTEGVREVFISHGLDVHRLGFWPWPGYNEPVTKTLRDAAYTAELAMQDESRHEDNLAKTVVKSVVKPVVRKET